MIYGYGRKTVSDKGMLELKEVSIIASVANLRSLAGFIEDAANQLETEESPSANWHRHIADAVAQDISCDVVVSAPGP